MCYVDFVWHKDAHHLASVRQTHFFQTRQKMVEPYHPKQVLRQFGIQQLIPAFPPVYRWYTMERYIPDDARDMLVWMVGWLETLIKDVSVEVAMALRVAPVMQHGGKLCIQALWAWTSWTVGVMMR